MHLADAQLAAGRDVDLATAAGKAVHKTLMQFFHAQLGCGEVSLVYRFSYSIRDGKQVSRLPVTLNMVFPALPSRTVSRKVLIDWSVESVAIRKLIGPNHSPV